MTRACRAAHRFDPLREPCPAQGRARGAQGLPARGCDPAGGPLCQPGLHREIEVPAYTTDWDSDAYLTVSGQNSNNTVRVADEFVRAVLEERDWNLVRRTDGKVAKTLPAKELWDRIGFAAWASADPGIQYDTTINDWHTCPESGRINASNPCSEYMFLDDTACNLASLNLMTFKREDGGFAVEDFVHACSLWTIVLEIAVLMAQFPSRKIAELSYRFRTLGLGYANLGGLLMATGVPYDSDAGRAFCAAVTALMTGVSYRVSALMARELGPFPGYADNRDPRLARPAQPPARGLERDRGLRVSAHAARPARRRELPVARAGRGRA